MARRNNKRRDDGRIPVQIYLGRDENNKRKYKTVYGSTQKEADKKAEELRIALNKGIDITAEYDAFKDWAERWIKIKKTEISHSQYVVYVSAIKHINRYLAHVPISKIRVVHMQDIINDLQISNPNTKKPASRKLLEAIRSAGSQVFDLAIQNRVMDYNPASAVRLPKISKQLSRRALTADEQQWITDTPHRAQCAAMIMMYSGLRKGELIPLTWRDINLTSRTISVTKTVERINGKYSIKNNAKTISSVRSIDIPQKLVSFLSTVPKESIYVCVTATGRMHTPNSWKRMWESYLADLNIKYGDFSPFDKKYESKFDPKGVPFVIPNITPHWLRHTFATMLYFAGVDILTAKEQLGHSDIKTTLDIYTHLDALHKRKAMNKLDEYLSDASQMHVK